MRTDVGTLKQAKALKARWERQHGCVCSISAYEKLIPTKKGLKPVRVGYRVSCPC